MVRGLRSKSRQQSGPALGDLPRAEGATLGPTPGGAPAGGPGPLGVNAVPGSGQSSEVEASPVIVEPDGGLATVGVPAVEGPAAQQPVDRAPGTNGDVRPTSTRASAVWTALAAGMVLLVVVLVFILENLQDVKVTFFSLHWHLPLAIDLLLAAVLGGAVVFLAGAVRLLQLRIQARRQATTRH